MKPPHNLKEVDVAVRSRFTRIPKVQDLILAGVPTEVIPTYAALADHANNKTGLCWPRMETLARRLSRSPRTIQRHLHLLQEKGLVEFVERKRDWHGRFGAYVYRVVHIVAAQARKGAKKVSGRDRERERKKRPTTGHGGRMAPNRGLTKRHEDPPNPPKEAFNWFFGKPVPEEAQEEYQNWKEKKIQKDSQRRRRGYEWLF